MSLKIDLKFKIGNLKFKRFTRRRLLTFISTLLVLVIGSFTFLRLTQPATAAWYSDSWGFRKKLTIDYTKVSGGADLTNFPVLVSLTDLNLTKAQSTGNDIVFTSSDGSTKLDHEIEKFTQSSGELVAWVEIPTLSYTANTIIYIYYGNPSAPDQSNKTGVWDANYVGVWHLPETSGNHLNSTSTSGIDSNSVSVTQQGTATGKADGADEFNGVSNIVTVADNDNLTPPDNTVIEAWVKLDSLSNTLGHNQYIFHKKHSVSPWDSFILNQNYASGQEYFQFTWIDSSGTGYTSAHTGGGLSAGTWYYLAGVRNGTSSKLYLNGTNTGYWWNGTPDAGDTMYNSDGTLRIGVDWGSSLGTDGVIDELRISNIARTDGWIATTYNTINSPSTFFSKGSEEKNRQPVLNFGFDEGYGTTAEDSSPGNNDGTLAGSTKPTWQTEDLCISGKCLYFNGSTASVTVANTVNNVQSISFWVKPKTNGETLLDLDGGTHYISASAGTISATGFSTPTIYVNGISGAPLVANTWQNVVITTATKFNATSIKIGNVSAAFLNGFIDEFKIYDYARSAAQVKTDYAGRSSSSGAGAVFSPDTSSLSQGLVGYWKMDESSWTVDCSTTSVTDSSGNGNNGKSCPTSTGPAGGAAGKFGNAGSFDGSNDYVSVANNSSYKPTTAITLAGWIFNPSDSTKTSANIMAGYDTDDLHLYAAGPSSSSMYPSIYLTFTSAGAQLCQQTSSTLSLGAWSHLTGTFDGKDEKIYLNGTLVKTCSIGSDTISQNSNPLALGSITSDSGFTYGKL